MGKFLNISNHPSSKWSESQIITAMKFGDIIDIPFPQIDPETSAAQISILATDYVQKVEQYEVAAVMVQGEFTFSYALIKKLREKKITVVASCTKRVVTEKIMPDGTVAKNSIFDFCGFREYE